MVWGALLAAVVVLVLDDDVEVDVVVVLLSDNQRRVVGVGVIRRPVVLDASAHDAETETRYIRLVAMMERASSMSFF